MKLELSKIRTDGGTQMRADLNKDVYMDYRDKWLAGASLPPVDVFYDGVTYRLADGFHRFYGAREADLEVIEATIHEGTQRDAILFACGANASHGLFRTNADKRRAVETLLNDEEWVTWSDHRLAEQASVSQQFVSNVRRELTTVVSSPAAKAAAAPRTGKDGKARRPPAPKPAQASSKGAAVHEHFEAQEPAEPESDDSIEGTIKRVNSDIESFCRKLTAMFDQCPEDQWLSDMGRRGTALQKIKQACDTLRTAKCHAECPLCEGDGCASCHNTGRVPKSNYDQMV